MALLNDAVESKKYDVRLVERNIARGRISQEDYSKSVKGLPDDAENAEWIEISSFLKDREEANSHHGSENGATP